jgi:hypothetical protein
MRMPLGPTVTSGWASVIKLLETGVAPANAGNAVKHNAAENTKVRAFMKTFWLTCTIEDDALLALSAVQNRSHL